MNVPARLLAVDDEVQICELVRDVAEDLGFEAETATRHAEFMAAYRNLRPDIITLDLQMPDVDGIEVIRFLADERSTARIVIMSGVDRKVLDTAKRLAQSRGLDVVAVVQKPFRICDLESVLAAALSANGAAGRS